MPTIRATRVEVLIAVGLALMALSACGDDRALTAVDRAEIQVVPSEVVFDQIAIGSTQQRTLTIENAGGAPMQIASVTWSGNADEFEAEDIDGIVLEAGEVTSMTITYAPTDADIDDAELVFASNASNAPELRVPVRSIGQSALIAAAPDEVTLIATTGSETVDVELYNIGSRPFDITDLRLATNAGEFSLGEPTMPIPATLAPGDSLYVPVTYTPATPGFDADQLFVGCDADNCDDGRILVPINGVAEAPRLRVTPGDVAFGAVPLAPSPAPTQTVVASNEGQGTLFVESIAWAFNPADGDDEFQIVSVAGEAWDPTRTEPWALEPGESFDVILSYAPADAAPDLENLVFRSNDAGLPQQTVRVGGTLAAPRLQVFPTEVGFPLTALGLTSEREVIISNVGSEPLQLDPLRTFGGGFSDGAFALVNGDAMPSELGPGDEFTLELTFTPSLADFAHAGTVYVLPTNDPATDEVRIDVTGTSAQEPVCEVRPLPVTLDFGTVPRGTRAELTARVRNTGSGPCEVQAVVKQTSLFGFLFSDYFSLVSVDPPAPTTLEPGDELLVTAAYFPLTVTDLAETFGDAASVEVRVRDPYDTARTVTCGVVPGLFTGVSRACGINLQARSAIAEVAAIPGAVDFGLVTLGCNSQTQTVRVYNTGGADVEVTSIALEDCTPEMELAGIPTLPRYMASGDSFAFQTRYRPADEGADACRVVIENTASGRLVVPLTGEGVTFSRTVDRFEQVSGREVDVLFVVDNSGSMGEEQSNLARNFSSFIAAATTWDTDFQIGVVTTQTEGDVGDPSGGTRLPGQFVGNPRIITPRTPSYAAAFERNIRVGDADTSASSSERGLESARMALTDPHITDVGTPCTSDADCGGTYLCVDAADGSGRACGGYNRTFIREDASLEIVFVSDEEDQSRAELSFYEDFFRSIKGYRNTSLFHASAIVGPRGGCSSSNGDADAGNRYIDLADSTGGEVSSICDADFASSLADIGNRAFGLRIEFFLSRAADPSTVSVWNLASCSGDARAGEATGWTYFADTNSIVWDEGSAPTPGECFEVEYEAACF